MPVAGVVICMGCRQRLDLRRLDQCECSYMTEAEAAEYLAARRNDPDNPAFERCRRCNEVRELPEDGLCAGLCADCVLELQYWM